MYVECMDNNEILFLGFLSLGMNYGDSLTTALWQDLLNSTSTTK